MNNKINLETMRHSCAHVLAAAVKKLYPKVKFGIGPAIENGFYYDFEFPQPISDANFPKIEKEMEKIIKQKLLFVKEEILIKEAKKLFKDQPYKLDLIDEISVASHSDPPIGGEESRRDPSPSAQDDTVNSQDDTVSIYQLGDFTDLCRGPHVKDTSKIGAFKLTHLAGAYWKGDEKNPMLTRIYGTAFGTPKELDDHLNLQEEAKKRDHRRLGKDLDLFTISEEVGAGLPIWHPNLSVVRGEIENFWREEHQKRGYQYIYSPHMGKKALWEKSGHWKFYREMMYSPMDIEGTEYLIKPMNCPFHVQIYKSQIRSYKDLPLRYCELGTVYRFEPSGTLHGLTRVRGFTQDDSHIFCRPDQLEEEILGVLDLAIEMLSSFGFKEWEIDLSVRDPKEKEKYMGSEKIWKKAEESLEKALKKKKIKYQRVEGEAVFYGPKIDIKLLDALGRAWQCTTIQVDFNFPEKFDLNYIGEDGQKHRVVMVHRTILGSMERFIGCLIEHYAGAFPVWLSPVQVVVIPISERHVDYAQNVVAELALPKRKGEASFATTNIRAELDNRDETMEKKIRDAQLQKIPYMLIVGDKEIKSKTVSVRLRTEKDLGAMSLEKFSKRIKEKILTKALDL